MGRGLCREVDPDLFFPEQEAKGSKDAKRICRQCEVQQECGAYGFANPELRGIWGGFTERDRRRIKRELRERRRHEEA
jgi:WhiB family redox-sensing transcriptional regulator